MGRVRKGLRPKEADRTVPIDTIEYNQRRQEKQPIFSTMACALPPCTRSSIRWRRSDRK